MDRMVLKSSLWIKALSRDISYIEGFIGQLLWREGLSSVDRGPLKLLFHRTTLRRDAKCYKASQEVFIRYRAFLEVTICIEGFSRGLLGI